MTEENAIEPSPSNVSPSNLPRQPKADDNKDKVAYMLDSIIVSGPADRVKAKPNDIGSWKPNGNVYPRIISVPAWC